ncbi:MAG: hypothetical protein OET44_19560, partial [Gammaproteobacteria bacterium]|nr:hypothetical protein [Gammaproteobacteria bacterium]
NKKDRVKGYRIIGQQLSAVKNTRFTGPIKSDKFSRINCKHWMPTVSCPTNQVVTGFQAHFQGSAKTKRNALSGVKLVCRKLLWK